MGVVVEIQATADRDVAYQLINALDVYVSPYEYKRFELVSDPKAIGNEFRVNVRLDDRPIASGAGKLLRTNYVELELFDADGRELISETFGTNLLPIAPMVNKLIAPFVTPYKNRTDFEIDEIETFEKYLRFLIAIKTSVGRITAFEEVDEYTESKDVSIPLSKVLKWLPQAIQSFPSVLEHIVYSFYIEKCPRSCSHQLVRHRIASYTQSSTRYFKQRPEFVSPTEEVTEFYEKYEECLKKLPLEQCRHLLPISLATSLVMTVNLRELLHIIKLRATRQASPEIRFMALQMAKIIYEDWLWLKKTARCCDGEMGELRKLLFNGLNYVEI